MAKIEKFTGTYMSVDPAEAVERNRAVIDRIRETIDEAAPADPESAVIAAETGERVRRVLAALPARDAQILRAFFLEGQDKEELCREYGIDREYLRLLLHRAKERFRTNMAGRKSVRDSSFSTERGFSKTD